jgi:hypothetical protein
LVHSFPEEDLHFLIHDIGAQDDALPILALASNRQWEYLLDMEAWSRDQLDYRQTAAWLQLLLQAGSGPAGQMVRSMKSSSSWRWFCSGISNYGSGSRTRLPSDLGDGFFTDDDTFYVRFVDYPVATPKEEERSNARRDEMLGQLLTRLSVL